MLLTRGGEFRGKGFGIRAVSVALGGAFVEGALQRADAGFEFAVRLAQPFQFRGERYHPGLPAVGFRDQFGLCVFVSVAGGGELAEEGVVGLFSLGDFLAECVARRAQGGALPVKGGERFAVQLPGSGEFRGKRVGGVAQMVALGGEFAERFFKAVLRGLQAVALAAQRVEGGGVRLAERSEFLVERLRIRGEPIAAGGQVCDGGLVRGLGRGGLGGERLVGGPDLGELRGESGLFAGELFVRRAEFGVRLCVGLAGLADGGKFAPGVLADLLHGGGHGIEVGEQCLAFLLRGVALVGELFTFRAELGDRRVAACAGGFEFAGELGPLGGERLAGAGCRSGDGGERCRELPGEGGLLFVELLMARAELDERLLGLAAGGFGCGELFGRFGDSLLGGVGVGLRLFSGGGLLRGFAELRGKALAVLVCGGEFLLELLYCGVGRPGALAGGLLPALGLRCPSGGELRGERLLFSGDAVALAEERLNPAAVVFDVGFELLHGAGLPGFRRGGGGRIFCEPFAGVFQLRGEPDPGGVDGLKLLLRFLHRAGRFGIAFAGCRLKFAPQRGVRFLDVGGAFAVQAVGRGELALQFDLRLLFPAQFQSGLALAVFQGRDPALEFIQGALAFLGRALLPAGGGRGVAGHREAHLSALLKLGDLLGKRGLLLR